MQNRYHKNIKQHVLIYIYRIVFDLQIQIYCYTILTINISNLY